MTIAVDYDGTLEINGKPNIRLINRLRIEQKRGNIIILWTCRQGKSLNDAVAFLKSYGFIPNYINQNTPQNIQKLGYDSRKILADFYIDDKGTQ